MRNAWFAVAAAAAVLSGCASPQQGAIPVQDSGTSVSNQERVGYSSNSRQTYASAPRAVAQPSGDSGVTVGVPQDSGVAPIQTYPAQSGAAPLSTGPITTSSNGYGSPAAPVSSAPSSISSTGGFTQQTYQQPAYQQQSGYQQQAPAAPVQAPSGIPSRSAPLAADEQLDGPVLALLTTAQQQQGGGDLNGASASLERAQRIAPREPQVLYKLAQVRLAQGDNAQAEQVARRGLSLANGRPTLQASLWDVIAKARAAQGDAAGAATARQNAKATL
ncbi:tetratricopeptide repeat protein [Pseudomonas citronellolis]|uniref:tetratricopeptide repeat protein n=1 Tax=Pseudomonas citronellolis TaxID=53408 RepID=UPI0023E4077C|nr:tetratricopeptide repeat protein [Pseudomonas citronellolis]MDF3931992.1 tetratricopeptide repeat protein [Pseudomonas citronellolis]